VFSLVRYTLATVLLSQRYLPPLLLFVGMMAVFTSNDDGSLLPVYAFSAAAVFICGTWLTIATVNAEDPVQRSITIVNTGGVGRVLAADLCVALAGCTLISVVGLLYPLTTGRHVLSPAALLVGLLAELTGGLCGMAVGLLCSRPVIRRAGWSMATALLATFALLLIPGMPPMNRVFRLMTNELHPAAVLAKVIVFCVVSVVLVIASAAVTRFVAIRRD
jgi:hypothetical protein